MSRPDWTGRTAVVIANGPSLTEEQCLLVRDSSAGQIAVNTAYQMAPWAWVFYAGDFLFHKTHHARMAKLRAFPFQTIWTCDATAAEHFGLHRWKGRNDVGLGEKTIHLNGNSGAQAINLAYLFGARKIVLLGFTMAEINGKKHFHGDHEKPLVQKQLFEEWLHKMTFVARDAQRLGVDIVNCDPLSAMTCFRRGDLGNEL
jgi:hypothetical protein